MQQCKKIAILTMSMGSGGAEKVISLLLKELVKEYEVSLFLFYNYIHYDIPKSVNLVTAYDGNNNGILRRILSSFVVAKMYYKFLRDNQINLSISFLFRPNIINGYIKRKLPLVKVVMSERNFPSKEYKSSKIRYVLSKFLIKKFYNLADRIFSNSVFINQDLKDNFGVRIHQDVIYNPIVLPKTVNQNLVDVSNNTINIVSVGRFETVKNHELLFKSIKSIESVSLTIIGGGRLENVYKERIYELGIYKKTFLPGVSKTVTQDLLAYDVFVLCSNSEGFPNALLEAMSVGLPVISTNCLSGPLELLNDGDAITINKGDFFKAKHGLLINVDDVLGLQKAIQYFQLNTEDKKKYAQKALNRAKDFDVKVIYQDFKKIIDN